MIFSSVKFFVFFALVFGLYWGSGLLPIARERLMRLRVLFLLIMSYVFYISWNPYLLSLIVASTTIDYLVGLYLPRMGTLRGRRWLLGISMVGNLGMLGVFKYANFFIDSMADLMMWFGMQPEPILLNIVLPVGISFYTFQSMSYTIDVYRGQLEPERDYIRFAFFVAFFPQLVAGPIMRATDFLPQAHVDHRLRRVDFDRGINLILRGLAKKVLVADMLAPMVEHVFVQPTAFGTTNTWIAAVAYSIQIYGDFSGYSDIAIGTAELLGYKLMKNFDLPYLARGFSDFWRRWHISLSTWLRDYLYISLGGNRRGERRTYINLFLTMLLGGLWHGAAYTFVVWGAIHGIMLALERMLREPLGSLFAWVPRPVRTAAVVAFTFAVVTMALVVFRAATIQDAMTLLRTMVVWRPDYDLLVTPYMAAAMVGIIATHFWGELTRHRPGLWHGPWNIITRPVRVCLIVMIIGCTMGQYPTPFIYFQF